MIDALAFFIRNAAERYTADLELELRLSVDASEFYAMFTRALCSPDFLPATVQYSGTRSASTTRVTRDGRAQRIRVDCYETSLQVFAVSVKERVGVPVDAPTKRHGWLRFDLATETSLTQAPPLAADTIMRHKQRVSFKLARGAAWRVDFTRVDSPARSHEIEIELDNHALGHCSTDTEARVLASQALAVLAALGVEAYMGLPKGTKKE